MRLTNIIIKNFKSIKELALPTQEYGKGNGKSKTTMLLGLNETGKSTIIDAIIRIKEGFKETEYPEICHIPAQEANELVFVRAEFKFIENSEWEKMLDDKGILPDEIRKSIRIQGAKKTVFLKVNGEGFYWRIELDPIDLSDFVVLNYFKDSKKNNYGNMIIQSVPEYMIQTIKIPIVPGFDVKNVLQENHQVLNDTILERFLAHHLSAELEKHLPSFIIWRPDPEHLMSNPVDLESFKDNPSQSQTLRGLFQIYGQKSDDDIKRTIERALGSHQRVDELRDGMSAAATKHLNNIWKEHPVKLKISINGSMCAISVEDKDRDYKYYRLNQRSDGFKQFVSLILSISAYNRRDDWSNNLILIDEPEVHLHPSGIQFMRDEIIKIGKKNDVIVATHSQQMVDTTCPERHWIVSKTRSETFITQVDKDSTFYDDEVMAAAFGLHLLKELLPSTIILVEGIEDKLILGHVLMMFSNRPSFSIKPANGVSKVYGFAATLAEENVKPYVVVDDDGEGKDAKKTILDNLSYCYSLDNVFTLKDINTSLPSKSMLEDLLPVQFVKSFFSESLQCEIKLDDKTPVIFQLKQQNKAIQDDKQKLASIKKKLAEKFVKDYDSLKKIESEAPRLYSVVSKLLSKFETK